MLRLLVALFYLFAVAASADEYRPPSGGGGTTYTFSTGLTNTGGTVTLGDSDLAYSVGVETLGASGSIVGKLVLYNATSGSVTIAPATGALGTVTATLPANTGTIAELNLAQTWTAAQQFSAGTLAAPGVAVGYSGSGAYSLSSTQLCFADVNGTCEADYGITNTGFTNINNLVVRGSTGAYFQILAYAQAGMTVTTAALTIGTGSSLVFSTLPSGTPATYACFTSGGVLVSSASAC